MAERNDYPFAALVGQDRLKLALILNVINPTLSGVLIRGEKGTGKSTAVRSLARVLPKIETVAGCPFQLGPAEVGGAACADCPCRECRTKVLAGRPAELVSRRVRVVELPVGATEDRVVGTMDLERALKEGEKRFEPGLLAGAHRGILYVDEVNLLDDHVVDVLLDSAAMGAVTVEREGISFTHPARFTLVGTMNPEEGDLRPQLLDRFGLCVQVAGLRRARDRVEIMERRAAFDRDPETFRRRWLGEEEELTARIEKAAGILDKVAVPRDVLVRIAEMCLAAEVQGHRADIVILKAAKTLAAWEGRTEVREEQVERAAAMALPHRMRRLPFEEIEAAGPFRAGSAGVA